MSRFWIPDSFIREHARNLSSSAHSVFMSLSSHANADGETFVSYFKMAKELGFSKNTVKRAVDELIAYKILVRLDKKTGRASHLKILSVPNNNKQPAQILGAKEYNNKELFKENVVIKNFQKPIIEKAKDDIDWERRKRILDEMRSNLAKRFSVKNNAVNDENTGENV